MALGVFYLTSLDERLRKKDLPCFSNTEEAYLAYLYRKITLRQPILVKVNGTVLETSLGRIMFNEKLPREFGFINENVSANKIRDIIREAIITLPEEKVADLIDDIKEIGFFGATFSGISVSNADLKEFSGRDKLIAEAQEEIKRIHDDYQNGLITDEERRRLSNNVWLETTEKLATLTWNIYDKNDIVKIIAESGGARAGKDQIKQLAAMRGLVYDPLGNIVELPITSNFRRGLSVFEYITSARGSRKGLTDSALRTADAGYLTRRLVDVAHDVIVRTDDCGTEEGKTVNILRDEEKNVISNKLLGRVVARDLVSKKNKKVIVKKGEEIDHKRLAEILQDESIKEVEVRSPLLCKARFGVCAACYGWDLSTYKRVEIGTPVGVIAAQSIGEPGTQLTMRVRHFGGIVVSDVTQGLPRVEELFEARRPKSAAPVAEIPGKVQINEIEDGFVVRIRNTKVRPVEEKEYFVPRASTLTVKEGDTVYPGMSLCEGYLDPRDILKTKGLRETQDYIITEIQKVYESQGINIAYKHLEVILRKMSDKVIIETPGDTRFLPGDLASRVSFEEENKRVLSEGGEPASAREIILGITKSSLVTDSWLSAASFQETTQVLTDAAMEGKEDYLVGLKENVIVGRLIPVRKEFIREF
jgi:DNA-directed RNA polymerase subunit beta'